MQGETVMIYFPAVLKVSPPHGLKMHCTLLFFVGVSVKQTSIVIKTLKWF